jgi:protein-S-isoprenylcysteine O-methyltransferase Ste14
MDSFTQIWITGAAFLISGAIILPIVRRDYLEHGRLNQLTAFLQLLVWFAFHIFLALAVFADLWPPLEVYFPKNWVGVLVFLVGLVICFAGMIAFRSTTKITGRETNRLIIKGIYRWSRNPQYLGYGLIILGIVIGYWTATAWLALAGYVLLVYATVRIEETHLENVFGDEYRTYCQQVRRFLGRKSVE